MKTLRMEIELEYDDNMEGDGTEEIEWFRNCILMGNIDDERLILHSNAIGDEVGTVRVLRIYGWNQTAAADALRTYEEARVKELDELNTDLTSQLRTALNQRGFYMDRCRELEKRIKQMEENQ